MLIVLQRGTLLRPRLNLAPSRLGQLVLAMLAVALVFGPLLREAAPHNEQPGGIAGSLEMSTIAVRDLLSEDAAPADGPAPGTSPHNHCVIYCSLASLIFPMLLLGALLLAARLFYPLPLVRERLTAPPLSPPPQHAR